MKLTKVVRDILDNYEGVTPGVKTKIANILMNGSLAGTGKLLILPVDQGHEHGPVKSFQVNESAYDPHYHYKIAIDAGLNAYAAPLGFLEAGSDTYAGQIPTILKINSSNSLSNSNDQAITGTIRDALRLGCSAVGFTIYPGSEVQFDMIEEFKELIKEASAVGLASVLWSYPRGPNVSKEGETALDVIAYAAHIAALLGAHIIKVKPPSSHVVNDDNMKLYKKTNIDIDSLSKRVAHIKKAAFCSRRIVVFSGGTSKNENELYNEIRQIRDGGGNGSIIGRNTFQRPRADAINLLKNIIDIYKK